VLEISRSYLMELADRVLRPLDITGPPSIMGATDGAFLEFLMLCLVERVNRDLAFPFRFEVARFGTIPDIPQSARGISVACSVSLLAATGALRVFVPYSSLQGMRHQFSGVPASGAAPRIEWKFPVSIGSATLAAKDVAGLEREDVLIFEPALELLFPHRFDRGWKALPPAAVTNYPQQISNLNRLLIDIYFERESLKINDSKAANPPEPNRAPDLNDLPVRLHVILADKELTLADAAGLTKGSIVELDAVKNGVVSLAVNGKVLGEGQLVEVQGRLGVKVLSWRGA
jgi:flagellar motor switch/type III secretory pathway protein FliN